MWYIYLSVTGQESSRDIQNNSSCHCSCCSWIPTMARCQDTSFWSYSALVGRHRNLAGTDLGSPSAPGSFHMSGQCYVGHCGRNLFINFPSGDYLLQYWNNVWLLWRSPSALTLHLSAAPQERIHAWHSEPCQNSMAGESIDLEETLLLLWCYLDILSNWFLNICIYTPRLLLLSTTVREGSFCSSQQST